MKNKKNLIYIFIILFVIFKGFKIIESNSSEIQTFGDYAFEKTKKNVIEKNFDGNYLYPLVTITLNHENLSINIKGIDKSKNVFIINPNNGERFKFKLDEYNKFTINMNLEKDIDYGIIMDYKLIGSIRVVDDLNIKNENELYMDILTRLGCGL